MPEFTVCAKSEVKKTAKRFNATHIISLLDPHDHIFRPPAIDPKNHLTLNFLDEENENISFGPKDWHAKSILDFGTRLPHDARVIVHCHAGICRSTSAALALWLQANGLDRLEEAENWLHSVRPIAIPNSLLTKHFDNELNLNGKLINLVSEISVNNTKRLLIRLDR